MGYHHVIVKDKANKEKRAIFTDLSKSEVNKKFAKLYKRGKDIFFDGEILPVNQISKIAIISTKENLEVELKKIQEKSRKEIDEINKNSSMVLISIGHGYNDEDIEEYGNNVTSQFITGGPGEQSFMSKLIHHPLFVRIIAGILLLAIGLWLKSYLNNT